MARSVKKIPAKLAKRAKQIRVLLMDVDGTLARGVWLLSRPDGTAVELKGFDPHDGLGLTLARLAGIRTGLITGRESPAVTRRARELDLEFVYQKQAHKTSFRSEIQATDSTCSGCSANTNATKAHGQRRRVACRRKPYSSRAARQ